VLNGKKGWEATRKVFFSREDARDAKRNLELQTFSKSYAVRRYVYDSTAVRA